MAKKTKKEQEAVAAEAEKQANELRTQALTPAILQQMWIEKWDGTLPATLAGNDSKMLLNLPSK
jgi:ribosome recycling factor